MRLHLRAGSLLSVVLLVVLACSDDEGSGQQGAGAATTGGGGATASKGGAAGTVTGGTGGTASGAAGANTSGSSGVGGEGQGGTAGSGASGASGSSGLGGDGGSSGSAGNGGSEGGDAGSGGEGGDAGSGGEGECEPLVDTPAIRRPVDLVVAVDTSGTMDLEVGESQSNILNYMQLLEQGGVAPRLVLIADSTMCVPQPVGSGACAGADENLPGYRHVTAAVGSQNALQTILDTYPSYSAALRDGALKSLLVVSDDDSNLDGGAFTSQFLALDPAQHAGFAFDAIAADDDPGPCFGFSCPPENGCCSFNGTFCEALASAEGVVYRQLAAATQGSFQDQCAQDFDPLFVDLAAAALARATLCSFPLTVAQGDYSVRLTLDGASPLDLPEKASDLDCAGDAGWYRIASPASLELCPATCEAAKASVAPALEIAQGCG